MTEYRIARPGEEEAILDHINLVFSQAHQPHHFDALIPKVYGHSDHAPLHAVALENGRIRAAIGLLPLTLQLDENHALNLGFVGSVSVHERSRGKGHMKKLMEMILAQAKERAYDFLALGGQRQRYGYWDFENGSGALNFEINSANIRHALREVKAENIVIRRIEGEDDPALEEIYALCCQQKMICHRCRDRFLEIMQNWQHHLYALEDAGRLIGYACGNEGWICEMGLQDEERLLPVIKAWMQGRKSVSITVPLHMGERARIIKGFAERYAIQDGEMLRILNWERVLQAALEAKHADMPLMDGRFVFEIQDEGFFALSLENGAVQVIPCHEAPERRFTRRQAVEFFFSPFSLYYAPRGPLQSWLPLPLNIPSVDAF